MSAGGGEGADRDRGAADGSETGPASTDGATRPAADAPSAEARAADRIPLIRLPRIERQAGALAWLPGDPLRFVLVTSRRTRRWVFPKGGIEAGHTAAETAAREAMEEAGVGGRVAPRPVGTFRCDKTRPPAVWTLEVEIFPLAVEEVREDWPESAQRERRFVTLAEARALLSEPAMLAIVERFAATCR